MDEQSDITYIHCDVCGARIEIGMYPFCKGSPSDHGTTYMRSGSGAFPFTTTNLDGKPFTVNNITELRRIERDYGVVFSAFNRDNWQDCSPTDANLPKFRGNDEDTKRDYRGRYERRR